MWKSGDIEMRAFQPATAGMPFGIALVWAMVDLQLAFWLRVTQVALELPMDWCGVLDSNHGRASENALGEAPPPGLSDNDERDCRHGNYDGRSNQYEYSPANRDDLPRNESCGRSGPPGRNREGCSPASAEDVNDQD